jgi:hypothetical protein
MKKRVIWCVIGFVFGALAIFGGITKMDSPRVECGGKSMYPGDTCEVTSKSGSKDTRTYEEQAKSNKGENWVIVAVGGIIILISAWQLVKGLRNRKKAAAGAPDDQTAHWNPPAPQSPQGWQAPAPQQQYQQGPPQGWQASPPPQQYQQPPQGWPPPQIPQQQPPPQQSWS